jgi:hypothetical protein
MSALHLGDVVSNEATREFALAKLSPKGQPLIRDALAY